MVRHICLVLAFVLILAPVALAVDLAATSSAGPGDSITWNVSNATSGDRVMVLASVRNTGSTFGPIETRCGTLQLTLGIGPGFRVVGHGRIAPDGTFSSGGPVPARLPSRFDGRVLHAQAITAHMTVTPNPPNPPACSITTATSNVADTTIHVP